LVYLAICIGYEVANGNL